MNETPAVLPDRAPATVDEAARKLILKAGRRWALNDDMRWRGVIRATELDTYGDVAADVLGICMVRHHFTQSIKSALQEVPLPYTATRSREAAAAARAQWDADFLEAALKRLGLRSL